MRPPSIPTATRAWFVIACFIMGQSICLPAREPAAYRVGDVAEIDITTPTPLDVVDPAATAALRAIKAPQSPAIFRMDTEVTNQMARDFLAAFAQARTNFLMDVAIEYHRSILTDNDIVAPDFERLVTIFSVENPKSPIFIELAANWARGRDDQAIRDQSLFALEANARFVRPDLLSTGFVLGAKICLAPIAAPQQKLSVEMTQRGEIMPATDLVTVSTSQAALCRGFSPKQQTFARAIAAFIRPNCFPDLEFTALTRSAAVYKLQVSDHYDAGDTLVRRGEIIDAKSKAALTALAALSEPTPAIHASTSVPTTTTPRRASSSNLTGPRRRHLGLVLLLAGISALSLVVAGWQYGRGRRRTRPQSALPVPTAQVSLPFADAAKPELAPQVALAVREAVQQELAMQRRELLLAQQAATDEIAALVSRLDELQVPMQARLHAYESRIKLLESELAIRDEENRALLHLRIEVTNRQLESERNANLIPPLPL